MGDRKFILFEFHQDGDLQIGPKTVSTGGSGESEPDEEAAEADVDLDVEGGGGSPSVLGAVLALVVLFGLALAARKLLGGGSDVEEQVVDVEE